MKLVDLEKILKQEAIGASDLKNTIRFLIHKFNGTLSIYNSFLDEISSADLNETQLELLKISNEASSDIVKFLNDVRMMFDE